MSAEGKAIQAEGAAVDAAAQQAETAATAASAAVAASAVAAANAEESAKERTEQLEEKVASELVAQKDDLSWLKTHAEETKAGMGNLSSALTTIAERQAATETFLQSLAERLTPPPSPETQEKTPEQIAAENSAATKENSAAQDKEKARPRNRWI